MRFLKYLDKKSKDKAMYEAHPPAWLYLKRYSRIYWCALTAVSRAIKIKESNGKMKSDIARPDPKAV